LLLLLLSLVCWLTNAAFVLARPAPAAAKTPPAQADATQTPILLAVDATEAPRKILHSRLSIPVAPGPLTLYYPKWIPGEHAPSGPVADLAGLIFTAGGKVIPWQRDPLDMFSFRLEVPPGVNRLEVALDYVSPTESANAIFTEGASTTEHLAVINWNQLLLYPKDEGRRDASGKTWAERLRISASLKLPEGWKFGTALPLLSPAEATTAFGGSSSVQFATASLAALIDSPVIAGRYFMTVPLSTPATAKAAVAGDPGLPGHKPAHQIDIAADSEATLRMSDGDRQAFNNLVAETVAMFGTEPYRDYHFLLALSNHLPHFGLEHHESSDNRLNEQFLADPAVRILLGSLLPHEYVHAWNGKYRVPADASAPEFQSPRKTGLLWVYEGLTTYLSMVLTARSGLWTPEQFREELAMTAMTCAYRPGRSWRSLQDTAVAAQVLFQAPPAWSSWRRGPDFYEEGALLWLEVDAIIRQQTHGRRSLDDFARLFFDGKNRDESPEPEAGTDGVYATPREKTYTFDDVVKTLNRAASYDWRRFFNERVGGLAPPLNGISQAGWMVVYGENPSEMLRFRQDLERVMDASASIGMSVQYEGLVLDAVQGMPAARAGIGPGMRIVAVNGRRYNPRVLQDAMQAGVGSNAPLQLLVENTEYYKTISLDYHNGPRYPYLVRDESRPDLLADIVQPRASSAPALRRGE
jgi:predicted metalloprotease with PDZ domain